jgi:hypothetical protein
MKVAKDRNYWLAFFGCAACTVLTLISDFSMEAFKRLILSDINVVIWLFVAWMFDDED